MQNMKNMGMNLQMQIMGNNKWMLNNMSMINQIGIIQTKNILWFRYIKTNKKLKRMKAVNIQDSDKGFLEENIIKK